MMVDMVEEAEVEVGVKFVVVEVVVEVALVG
jgi:hypothetical protein